VIELDGRLIPLLKEFVRTNSPSSSGGRGRGMEELGDLTIVEGNALHVPLPSEKYKVVANIPYHITSPLLHRLFLESSPTPTSLTLLIQKEVAETICDSENAGILTILVGLFGAPTYVCTVPAEAFLPPPEVDSAVLHVECFDQPLADAKTIERIFRLTKISFGQKRKMLRNSLGKLPNGMDKLQEAGIDPERRPQTLTIREWIALAPLFEVP
jgi:16S rRNA (adenine1518-N6/adenine1519-N6)-dimethyltransferase